VLGDLTDLIDRPIDPFQAYSWAKVEIDSTKPVIRLTRLR
jgi:hypothetical protein